VQFEKETGKAAFASAENLVAFSRVSLGMKLRQFASGFIYNDDSHETWIEAHREKIEALRELHETHDGPILVAYQFQSEYAELRKAFPASRRLQTNDDIDDWNAGRIPIGLVHPMSCGHGLNLQRGGNMLVWFSLTYDAELYAQLNKRLHRPGQKDTVSVIHLLAEGTIDEKILKILHKKEDNAERFESI
jgi:SNF2 family DNA or RNA helicase